MTGGGYVVGLNISLSLLICLGWGIFAGIKGGPLGGLIMGFAFGLLFSLPFLVYYIGESIPRPIYYRLLWALVPFLMLSWFFEVVAREGGLILFLQFAAIILPSICMKRPVSAFFSGLFFGVAFLVMCYVLYHFHIQPFGADGDNWTVIYPSVILFVSAELASVRFIINRLGARNAGAGFDS